MQQVKVILAALLVGALAWAAPAAAQDSTLTKVLSSGKLRVGTTGDWNPMSMKDPASGNYAGFDPTYVDPVAGDLKAGIPVATSPGPGVTAMLLEVRGYQMNADGTPDMAGGTDWVSVYVDVEHEETQGLAVPMCPGDLFLEPLVECTAIGDAGEAVRVSLGRELLVGLLELLLVTLELGLVGLEVTEGLAQLEESHDLAGERGEGRLLLVVELPRFPVDDTNGAESAALAYS